MAPGSARDAVVAPDAPPAHIESPTGACGGLMCAHVCCACLQVRAAQKGIPTGSVYDVNERNLHSVGVPELQQMLEEKNWEGLKQHTFEKHNSDTWTI